MADAAQALEPQAAWIALGLDGERRLQVRGRRVPYRLQRGRQFRQLQRRSVGRAVDPHLLRGWAVTETVAEQALLDQAGLGVVSRRAGIEHEVGAAARAADDQHARAVGPGVGDRSGVVDPDLGHAAGATDHQAIGQGAATGAGTRRSQLGVDDQQAAGPAGEDAADGQDIPRTPARRAQVDDAAVVEGR